MPGEWWYRSKIQLFQSKKKIFQSENILTLGGWVDISIRLCIVVFISELILPIRRWYVLLLIKGKCFTPAWKFVCEWDASLCWKRMSHEGYHIKMSRLGSASIVLVCISLNAESISYGIQRKSCSFDLQEHSILRRRLKKRRLFGAEFHVFA